MNRLMALLGSGQKKLTGFADKSYRQTKYIRQDNQSTIETPFVAEALIKLYPNRFHTLDIFGTKDSMWETLLVHCIDGETDRDYEIYSQLTDENRKIDDEALRHVAQAFQRKCAPNIQSVNCHLIPIGKTDDEIWQIFQTVTFCVQDNDVISIDVTHGLRYQSIFLLLAAVMMRTVKNINIDSVFYGAFELKENENAPIFDLKPLVEILDWTLAINDFQSYSNSRKLVEQLNEKRLKQSLSVFSIALQINDGERVRREAKVIQSVLQEPENQHALPPPAKLLLPYIQKLPRTLAHETKEWARYLKIARWQHEHEQIGLATLSTWEAVICRISELLTIPNYANNQKLYAELSRIARAKEPYQYLADLYVRVNLGDFCRHAERLNQFRKAIAHADAIQNLPLQSFGAENREILGFFEQSLGRYELTQVFSPEVIKTVKQTLAQNNAQ